MNIFQIIHQSIGYARGIYLVSAVYSLAAAFLCCFYPAMAPVCIILKLMCVPIILCLFKSFQGKHTIYFYLNLGISRNEYYAIPVVVELILFALLLTISISIGYVLK